MSTQRYPGVIESLRRPPFNLGDDQVDWVRSTLAALSTKDKAGQLFCGIARSFSEEDLDATLSICTPGGVMYRPCTTEEAVAYTKLLHR